MRMFLLSSPQRAESLGKTIASLGQSDWPGTTRITMDEAPEVEDEPWGSVARAMRPTNAFRWMLEAALTEPGAEEEWMLFLEDDLEFHPRFGSLLRSWPVLEDARCPMASLFNPGLPAAAVQPELPVGFTPQTWRAFAAEPMCFQGAQALPLRRWAIRRALAGWDSVAGVEVDRLRTLLGAMGPIWVHRPSLVQHVATDSSWGARVKRAMDFDPAWRPMP